MKNKSLTHKDIAVIVTMLLLLASSVFYFNQARQWIGREFPGFLIFENSLVGAFNQYEWPGTMGGLHYHDLVKPVGTAGTFQVINQNRLIHTLPSVFSFYDFLRVFILPYISGFAFMILGGLIYWFLRGLKGALPLFFFNSCVAYYLMASFDFHSDHHLSAVFLMSFSLLSAFMTHFALVYPEKPKAVEKYPGLLVIPYLITCLTSIPYLLLFYSKPLLWKYSEGAVVIVTAISYIFWIVRLLHQSKSSASPATQSMAKSLLLGQLLAFIVPAVLGISIFILDIHIPLNWGAPTTALFPLAALFGLILGRLRQTQLQLVQSEKMASLGQLLAGVAHEINNPTNFISSNIIPLKDYVGYLKGVIPIDAKPYRNQMPVSEVVKDLESLAGNMQEGTSRIQQIVSSLKTFSYSKASDISDVNIKNGIATTLKLLKHKLENRIHVEIDIPEQLTVKGNSGELNQVWLNILSNACDAIKNEGTIRINTEMRDNDIIVNIQDNGGGIPKESIRRIFDPFYTTKAPGIGTGLGLAIAQDIMKKHHGLIEIFSAENVGTTVKLIFLRI